MATGMWSWAVLVRLSGDPWRERGVYHRLDLKLIFCLEAGLLGLFSADHCQTLFKAAISAVARHL